jgi:hypothetical protein
MPVCLQFSIPDKPSKGEQAGNNKLQISNIKQITMTEIRNPKHSQDTEKRTILVIEYWSL